MKIQVNERDGQHGLEPTYAIDEPEDAPVSMFMMMIININCINK